MDFFSISGDPLGGSLLGNLLTGKEEKAKVPGPGVIRASKRAIATSQGRCTIRAGQEFNAASSLKDALSSQRYS